MEDAGKHNEYDDWLSLDHKKARKRRQWLIKVWRIISAKLKIIIGFFVILFIVLQIPFVQTFIAQQITPILTKKLGFPINIKGVNIQWFDEAKLYSVNIEDKDGVEMIKTDVLKLDFSIFSLIQGGDIYLDQVVLSNANVNLVKRDSLNISQFIKAITNLSKPKADTLREPVQFHIINGILDNVSFSYLTADEDSVVQGKFNPNNFQIDYITANLDNFRVSKDTIQLDLKSLSGTEKHSKLRVKRLRSQFQYSNTGMILDNLYAELNKSIIRDSIALRYRSPDDFKDFNDKVRIYANLNNSLINTEDLAVFAPTLRKYKDSYQISGEVKGTVNNLLIKNLDATFGKSSHVIGKATFLGLPNIESTLLDLKFKESKVFAPDLNQYVPNNKVVFEKLGTMKLNAKFFGFINDFVAKGDFKTGLGYLETDINFKTKEQYYEGKLITKEFDLGKFIDQEKYVQKINLNGKIKGTGLKLDNADFDLDAKVSKLGVMNYDYTNIYTDGHFQKKLFEGEIAVKDTNLTLAVDGSINFQDSTFNFIAKLDTISFEGTKLLNKSGYVKTLMEANFTGLEPSKISGEIGLFASEVMYEGTELELDFLSIVSRKNVGEKDRMLIVNSELFDFRADGDFQYKDLIADSKRFLQEIQLAFSGDDSLQQNYYASAEYLELLEGINPYNLNFKLKTKKVNKLIRLFDKKVYVSPNSKLNGELGVGTFNKLKLTLASDTLYYGAYETFSDTASLTIFKHVDSVFFNSELMVSSSFQDWDGLETKDLLIFSLSQSDELMFNNAIRHRQSGDKVNVQGKLSFEQDYLEFDLTETSFKFLEKTWLSSGISKVFYPRTGENIQFKNIVFSAEDQYVKIDGIASKHPDSTLIIDVNDFDLGIFSTYIGKEIKGKANIEASIGGALADLTLNSKINIDSISLAGYELGSLRGNSEWDNKNSKLGIEASMLRQNHEVIKIDGYYAPKAQTHKKLNVRTILDGASLKILQPFAGDFVSDIDGTAIGILKIKGPPTAPIIDGDVFVYRGKFKVNYLNTTYYFSDRIRFKEGFIGAKNLLLRDQNGQNAYLNGGIYHHEFSNFIFQLNGKLNNFMALNTTAKHNSQYYGTAIGSGTFGVFGPPDNLEISVTAKSEKGTKIYIPLDGYESVEESNFIKYINNDSLKIEEEDELDLKGIKMDFNIELTPEAYCEIIFDKKAGDIIRGNAQGKINMNIDLLGEFTMFGDVEIVKGAYNFTLLNVVNKEFGVLPNSHISWSGNPYGADLDITATYTQKASLAPIMSNLGDSSLINAPEVRRPYPIQVLLNLQGKLLTPDITFDIDVQEYPSTILANGVPLSLESYVAGFEQRIKRDGQELNRQVFSLIVLKKLSPENTFSGISQSAGSSVSELLTNQLSYWISQVDENLEIDVDLNSLGPDALNTFQLRLSYTFLDGRLRVSREGGFTNTQNEADPSSLIGDWTVEYLLTPDGKLKLKMYRKQNVNAFNTGLENNSTAGVSGVWTKSFDSLKDLFTKKKKKDKSKRKKDKKPNAKLDANNKK